MKGEYISIETLRIWQDIEKENVKLHKENKQLNELNCKLKKNITNDTYRERNKQVLEFIKNNDLTNNLKYVDIGIGDLFKKIFNMLKGNEYYEKINNIK